MTVVADLMRLLVLVVLVAVLALSWFTLARYTGRLGDGYGDRLRSRHVVKVAVSHIAALSLVAVETTMRLGQSPTLRLPVALVISALTLSALVDLLSYQRR